MVDQDHRVNQRGLVLIVIEVVDGLEVVARPPSIKVRSISGDHRIFLFEALGVSLLLSILGSLGFDLFPVLNGFPVRLAPLCSWNPLEHSLFLEYPDGISIILILSLVVMKSFNL